MGGEGHSEGEGSVSDLEPFDLDAETSRAWNHLQARLAVQLATMDDYLVLAAGPVDEEGGTGRYVQFSGDGEHLRIEASSNEYLTGRHRLDERNEAALAELGFGRPTTDDAHHEEDPGSPNFWLDSGPEEADRLASIAVKTLRDVFGLPHPAFVQPTGPFAEALVGGPSAASDGPGITAPRNRPHLQALIDETLIPLVGHVPSRDSDGDVPIPADTAVAFVRALHDRPAIQLYAEVVRKVQEPERAAFEVSVLNRDSWTTKYTFVDDRIIATVTFPAMPFVPSHLHMALSAFLEEIDGVDDDLAVRVSGRRFLDDVAEDSGAWDEDDEQAQQGPPPRHPAVLVLLELAEEGTKQVDRSLAASICEDDKELILALIRGEQEASTYWNSVAEDASFASVPADADIAREEAERASLALRMLRKALRGVAEKERDARRKARPRTTRQQTLFPEDG